MVELVVKLLIEMFHFVSNTGGMTGEQCPFIPLDYRSGEGFGCEIIVENRDTDCRIKVINDGNFNLPWGHGPQKVKEGLDAGTKHFFPQGFS